MKTLFALAIFGSGLVLSGCQAPVAERSHGPGEYGYYENGRHGYRGRPSRDGDYGPRNADQRNFPNSNVYVTTPHRDRVNQPIVRSQPRSERAAVTGNTPTRARQPIASKGRLQNPTTVKATSRGKKGSDNGTKRDKDAQPQQ